MNYKYNFELSSKRKIFLWLYQVLPVIDIIKYIYQLKEDLELEDILSYYGVLPNNIIIVGRTPSHIDDYYRIQTLKDIMKMNRLFMNIIGSNGLICSFTMTTPVSYKDKQLLMHGFWEYCATFTSYKPSLQQKIMCINKIIEDSPYLLEDICYKLSKILILYKKKNNIRIGFDSEHWYIPCIYF